MTEQLAVALVTLGDPRQLTGGYLFHRRLAAIAPLHQASVRFISCPQRPFPLAIVDAPALLRRCVTSLADIIVIDSIAAAFLGPWLALSRDTGSLPPLVGMLHQPPGGIDHGRLRATLQASLDRLCYARARMLLVASQSLADHLIADGVGSDRIRVVPPGRDVAVAMGVSAVNPRRGRDCALLCIGNWIERKGILSLLEAVARLPESLVTLHLAGDMQPDSKYGDRVRSRLGQPDLAGRVVVHGKLGVEDIAALYAAADVFALPSLKEPYGTVYGEAMASGLPVVGWRAGNLPYLAEDGREGLIVESGDISGLARALERLAQDHGLRQRLGNAARRRSRTRPTWEESAALFFGALREVATEKTQVLTAETRR